MPYLGKDETHVHLGLPDENFNKKPNNAKQRPEKSQTGCLKARKSQTLFAVLPFFCHKNHLN